MKAVVVAAIALLVAIPCSAQEKSERKQYGEALTLDEVTPIAKILAQPEEFLGERVLIQGKVEAVCENMGCWMDIAAEGENEVIQVKVDDGVIVFPVSAKGKRARVEGLVEKLELTYEEALEAAKHRAEEQGEEFDPDSVTGPVTTYRIRGIGAIIAE